MIAGKKFTYQVGKPEVKEIHNSHSKSKSKSPLKKSKTVSKTTQERGPKDLEIISGVYDNFWTQNDFFFSFFQAPVWRFDSKTLLQRFNVAGKDENGDTLYKSANLFSGYIASNRTR